jgi:alanine racemase
MEFGRIWAEIDLDTLERNLDLVRAAAAGRKLMLAIKADAYGHGAAEIGPRLQHKVDMFGVAGVEEGISLRRHGVERTPILVLSPLPYLEIAPLCEHDLSATVTEPEFARQLGREAGRRGAVVRVHVEVDTGMGRTGVSSDEVPALLQVVAGQPALRLEGIFTHFPAADSDFAFTTDQIESFRRLAAELPASGPADLIRHAANTSGILSFPDSHFDMIRPGLVVYGIVPRGWDKRNDCIPVRPVMTLRSRVVNIRYLPKGHNVSYARRFTAHRDSRIAVITAGYGDGYPWALTNRGAVLIRGRRAPIVGNVCMDLTMIDVTDMPETRIGDTVTLLGSDNGDTIGANELADWAETIPYEIICRVSPRVPRVFLSRGTVVEVRNPLNQENNGAIGKRIDRA